MIALMGFSGKIKGSPFSVLAGKTIPDWIFKTLDVEDMKSKKMIGDEPKKFVKAEKKEYK